MSPLGKVVLMVCRTTVPLCLDTLAAGLDRGVSRAYHSNQMLFRVPFTRFWQMKSALAVCVLALALLSTAEPLLAHHSTAMFDMANPITVTGVVKRFDWGNPHALIYLEVKRDNGNVEEWTIMMMSVNQLRSYGWARDLVKPGDVISCTGGRAKNGLPTMLSSLTRLADGRKIKS